MQTIEEAAIEFGNSNPLSSKDDIKRKYNGFKAGVEFAQQWIDVKEGLPEHYKELSNDTRSKRIINDNRGFVKTRQVLVKYRNGYFDTAHRCKCCTDDYYFWDCSESFEENHPLNIISWRPIDLK